MNPSEFRPIITEYEKVSILDQNIEILGMWILIVATVALPILVMLPVR